MYNIAAKEPDIPASMVFTAIDPIRKLPLPEAPSVEPGLNPNQPNARMKQPVSTMTMSCARMAFDFPVRSYLPIRGPSIIATANAVTPPTGGTTPEPAKSQYPLPSPKLVPRLASQPPPQAQLAKRGYVKAPRKKVEMINAAYFQRSQAEPVTIVVVVSMNTIWNKKSTMTLTSYVPLCTRNKPF